MNFANNFNIVINNQLNRSDSSLSETSDISSSETSVDSNELSEY